jgi:23S rRNA (cytosine1962-C5)-methyltransferase
MLPARIRIILKSGKEQSLRRYHPWIFSGAIKEIKGSPDEGDLVDVYSNNDEFLGTGHYAGGSIAVRILSFEQVSDIRDLFIKRITAAFDYRKRIGLVDNTETNAFRLINAEGDGMPALVVDFYNGLAVTQCHSVGMLREIDLIKEGLKMVLGRKLISVIDRSESTIPARFKPAKDISEHVPEFGKKEITENGNRFQVDLNEGQKTGFYLDQRENRELLGRLSSGRSVLNLFGFTGGFSVYAIRGGAKLVHTVDSSSPAVDLARENVKLNFGELTSHNAYCEDVSEFLQKKNNSYDLVISDPPAFAKHQRALENALQGYKRLNARIFEIIKPAGIVFTFSCSQVVSRENFRKSIFAAAANTGRKIKIMHQLSQPPDHPVSIYHPEGEYLKGLVLYVE